MTNRLTNSDIRYFTFCVNSSDIDTLRDSKDLFLKSKDKPVVVIDASLEGESTSFLYPNILGQSHNGTGLGGIYEKNKTILQLLHLPTRHHDLF